MSKQDFMKYLTFVKELFPKANIPANPEIIATWYKSFENTHLEIAKDMAQMYFQEEQNSFNYARLLQYKSRAMANNTYCDRPKEKVCKLCDGTGWIQKRYYNPNTKIENDKYSRCICDIGNNIKNDITQITEDELRFFGADKIIRIGEFQHE